MNTDNLRLLLIVTKINDSKLTELLKLRLLNHDSNISDNEAVDSAIYERLSDLYNPSTHYDEDIEFINEALFK
jgi:hypothetical protein